MFCPQCGAAPTPGGRFCGNCGTLLPFASMTAATVGGPVPRDHAVDDGARAAGSPRRRSLSFTVAVVACVVAFGVVFTAATSVVRTLAGDSGGRNASSQDPAASKSRGAMGALLSPVRHGDRSDAPKIR